MKSLLAAPLLLASVLSAQQPAAPRTPPQLPPPGVAVPPQDQRELRSGLDRLGAKIEALKANPHLPDVTIFHKAVRYALEGNEFYRTEQIFRAKELLRIGNERADSLARGDAPWTHATGLVVRGYTSKIDDSVQPYGLVVPPSFSPEAPHQWRVDAWFHGRSEGLNEIDFLWDRMHNPGEFTPRDTIVLHLYGRYCNASTFAGEVDYFEAIDDVKKNYNVDPNRILARGFSMGGASVWHIAAHNPGEFAAAAPGAGFAETMEFTGLTKRGYAPPWFEAKLFHLTNATDYAANFFGLPVVAYNGEIDPQKQAADIMARNMEEEGLHLSRVIGPNTPHRYHPDSKLQIEQMMGAIAAKGRNEWPREIRFTTWTLKYNKMRWVAVDGLARHWERARVDAEIDGMHAVRAKTENVTALSFEMGSGAQLLYPGSKVTVVLDGQSVTAAGPLTDGSWTAHFRKTAGKWGLAEDDAASLLKRHNLQGPIDDAFMDRFLMVRGTGTPLNETVGNWAKAEAHRAVREWRRQFRGDTPVKDDTAVTDADIASSNLVLWGDPQSNKVLARLVDKLPIHWSPDSIAVGTQRFPSASHAVVMIYPNPLNPKKYVVINSGFTFREHAYSNNALQIAQLPDYAVIDLTTPPDDRWPGKLAAEGFFGEKWELLAATSQ